MNMVFRSFVVAPIALILTATLFISLARVTTHGANGEAGKHEVPSFDFLLVEQNVQVELRNRVKPPPPKEVEQLEELTLDMVKFADPDIDDVQMPDVTSPDLNVALNINMGPALEGVAVAMPKPVVGKMLFDANPSVLKRTSPRYPSRALRKKIQGHVVVEFVVDTEGRIDEKSIKVVESVPPEMFDRAVLRSIKRWRFKPKTANGKLARYRARQRLEFKLDK